MLVELHTNIDFGLRRSELSPVLGPAEMGRPAPSMPGTIEVVVTTGHPDLDSSLADRLH